MRCGNCGAGLVPDQRYCTSCGMQIAYPVGLAMIGPDAHPRSGPSRLPVPPQMVTTFGAMALGFGFVVGNAISPAVKTLTASPVPSLVAEAPPPAAAPAPAPAAPGAGAPTSTPGSFVASSGNSGTTPPSDSGGGGGGKKEKKQKGISTLVGTVVHVNPAAGSYALAAGGDLQAVHADELPLPGDMIQVDVRKLKNGTYGQSGDRTSQGSIFNAIFNGTVTYRDDVSRAYTVSGRGSSVLVHVPADGTGGDIPPLGAAVTTSVQIAAKVPLTAPAPPPADPTAPTDPAPPPPPACVTAAPTASPAEAYPVNQTAVTVTAPHTDVADLEGVVQIACPADPADPGGPGELVLSADDTRESYADIHLALPAGLDLSRLVPGQPVSVLATADAANALTVTSIAGDQGIAGADDAAQLQGAPRLAGLAGWWRPAAE